ncbi:MAG: phage holin family protein, partial [Atopobiaceae bacterium]|nr:phage holin family protein [Atopobiaceae bacterium]
MPVLDPFIEPLRGTAAQTLIVALLFLSLLDVLMGSANAMFVQHDFSSHKFREGLIRKLSNLGLMCVADIIDAMLLSGIDLGYQPIFLAVGVSLALMEVWSLLEIYAEMHPEISDTDWYKMLLRSKEGL